jgi:Quinohemoprotein amine dehydrogenase, alpha subunit domain III
MAGKLRTALSILFVGALLGNAACSGDAGPAGPKGDQGDQGDKGDKGDPGDGTPSISAVSPSDAFIARTVDVVVSGNGTTFDAKTTVSFGSDVTVNKVTVASPTAILANITVHDDAKAGAVDVTVGSLAYKAAFNLNSPIDLGQTAGKAEQGGLVFVGSARGLDFTTPFDTTSTGDGLFTPIVYTDLALQGQTVLILSASDYTIGFAALIDVNAAAGPSPLTLLSGPAGGDIVKFPAGDINVAARTPKTITPGTTAKFTPSAALETGLFTYTPTDATGRAVTVSVTSADPNASPSLFVLDKSGKFANALVSLGTGYSYISSSTDKLYILPLDAAGGSGEVDVDVSETAVTLVTEAEPNDTFGTANPVSGIPADVSSATLSSEADVDWYKFTVDATAIGKSFHVVTTSPGDLTDTVVDVLAGDGVTSLGGPSSDQDYDEDFLSTAITGAGTYYVQISASHAGFFDPAQNAYTALITLE